MAYWSDTSLLRRFATIAVVVMIFDIITKTIMLSLIFDPPRVIVLLPILNFAPVWNEGVSFGFLAQGGAFTRYGISLLAVMVVIWLAYQLPELAKWQRIGAGLIAGGALGNVSDRIIYGKVVDFIDFHLGTWHYPAFNVADSAIFIGVGLWLLSLVGEMRRNTKDKKMTNKITKEKDNS